MLWCVNKCPKMGTAVEEELNTHLSSYLSSSPFPYYLCTSSFLWRTSVFCMFSIYFSACSPSSVRLLSFIYISLIYVFPFLVCGQVMSIILFPILHFTSSYCPILCHLQKHYNSRNYFSNVIHCIYIIFSISNFKT